MQQISVIRREGLEIRPRSSVGRVYAANLGYQKGWFMQPTSVIRGMI